MQLNSDALLAPRVLFDADCDRHGPVAQDSHMASASLGTGIEQTPSIQECVLQSVQQCPLDYRSQLLQNVILVGGASLYPGVPEKLLQELQERVPRGARVRVIAEKDRFFTAWKGASAYASSLSQHDWTEHHATTSQQLPLSDAK